MATARELLEHADALMRRNRAGDTAAAAIPSAPATPIASVATNDATADAPAPAAPPTAHDGVPLLTDVVEDFEPISIMGVPEDPVAAAEWPDFDDDDVVVVEGTPPAAGSAAGTSTQTVSEAPAETAGEAEAGAAVAEGRNEADAETVTITAGDAISLAASYAADHPDPDTLLQSAPGGGQSAAAVEMRWDALAEEVRMQVLQRIDIFTDTGLSEQLAARLQPIVDRASADLVATINHQVGQLLRTYVAEAIEREIDKLRQGGS